ncbi:MAG: membrane dipeptidase, partial [Planctomycetia bacterium]|nr:membrane dipeptidase [Planctomycetia bacterium]
MYLRGTVGDTENYPEETNAPQCWCEQTQHNLGPDSQYVGRQTDEGRRVHFEGFVFDGHNDLPWEMRTKADSSFDKRDIAQPQPKMHTDIPRLRAGGVKAQFWSVYVPAETAKKGTALN